MMDHGFRPYRDLGYMNMPGLFLIEWGVMHTLDGGPAAWRSFDLGLLGIAAAAMFALANGSDPKRQTSLGSAGLFAACLFELIHERDVFGRSGQRSDDGGGSSSRYTFLFAAVRQKIELRASLFHAAMFGLAAGVAATIKSTAIPLGLMLFGSASFTLCRAGKQIVGFLYATAFGYLVAPAIWAA